MLNIPNFYLLDNPLVKSKVSIFRDKNCNSQQFRKIAKDLSIFLCYEACKDLNLVSYKMETPLEETDGFKFGYPITFVSILRAGLGMVPGALECIPNASIGNIGIYRNEETLEAVRYCCKLPKNISENYVFVLDPMLATGASSCDAIDVIKEHGARKIVFLCLISAPEGVKRLHEAHPDVDIYSTSLDRGLNDRGYILPGLGDAGDRIFGTVSGTIG